MLTVLLRIYQLLIALPVLLVATVLTALSTAFGCILGWSRSWGYYPAHWWARLWCILMFVRIEVRGRENIRKGTSYVFVANHQGAYDIFLIYGYLNRNFKWMMKKSIEKIPLVGYACKVSKHIMVDRSSPLAIQRSMAHAKEILKDGMSLVIFPEGSRTPDGSMKPFKRGAFLMATEFGLPIVPLSIDGSFAVMRKSSLRIDPGRIVLTIHPPLLRQESENQKKEEMEELMKKSFEAIRSVLPEYIKPDPNV